MKSSRNKGYLALTATSILWGTTWVASKAALAYLPALELAAIRQILAGSIFLSYFLLIKKMPLPSLKQFRHLFFMAILLFVIANAVSTWGLRYIPTGLASLIGAMYPMSVVLIEKYFLKEKNTTLMTWVGMLIGVIGVLFLIGQIGMKESFSWQMIAGLTASILATLSWSVGSVFLSRHDIGLSPYYSMGWQMLIGSVLTTSIVMISGNHVAITSIDFHTWLMILYLVIAGSVLAFIAFLYSLKTLPAAISSLYAYVNPLVASFIAMLMLGEALTSSMMIGMVLTLGGVFLVNKSVKKSMVALEAEI